MARSAHGIGETGLVHAGLSAPNDWRAQTGKIPTLPAGSFVFGFFLSLILLLRYCKEASRDSHSAPISPTRFFAAALSLFPLTAGAAPAGVTVQKTLDFAICCPRSRLPAIWF